jgi:Glycosyltransferase family 87
LALTHLRYLQQVGNSRRAWSWLGLAVVVIALALDLTRNPWQVGIDFHTYLAAATVGLQQGWSNIYDQGLVAVAQRHLVPGQWAQPFLSPPTVAWLVTPLTVVPYWTAFDIWAVFNFAILGAALAWSGLSTGINRWILVVAALAPWWLMYAVKLGQVVPLVAAGVVVAWRLVREDRNVAAGVLLSVIFLKPNTTILVPVALLAAGRYRVLAAWLAAGGLLAVIAILVLGPHGVSGYVNQLRAPLPRGADALTLKGALDASGFVAAALRLLVVGMVLATAFRLRSSPGLVVPISVVGSMIVSPYLHGSDLCLLSVAAWMVWEERTAVPWRAALATGWVVASPFLFYNGIAPTLSRWPLAEYGLLLALVVAAWRPFTSTADLRTRAPA